MNEQLLQYLWQNALFRPGRLKTTEGAPVTVLHPGILNPNAGPDFQEARIRIGTTTWVGNIEVHMRTSDWHRHRHAGNPAYSNLILHVVYDDDEPLAGASFPTLELKDHLDEAITERYRQLMSLKAPIPCSARLPQVPALIWKTWLDRLLAERWDHRLEEWQLLWAQSGNDWRTLLYYRLAANFGFHVNRDAFLELALSLPLNILVRHRSSLLQTEALLFGQSGLLHAKNQDAYMQQLEREYHFLRRKYQLVPMEAGRWKFLRLRPSNFPTVRIAQFAMLVHKSLELFARMMEIRQASELVPLLDISAGSYWDNHYRFGETADEAQPKHLGREAIENILINTVAPMQYLYARLQGMQVLHEHSLDLLHSLKAERNKIMGAWQDAGIKASNAAESQALLQLFHQYCSGKNCLRCAVGNRLIRQGG